MTLPFSLEQFLGVFGAYNRALWPAAALLWLASAAAVVLILRGAPKSSRAIALLLAVHWAWSGVAYHLMFFRDINPAASVFGVLFVLQATLFGWWAPRAPAAAFQLQRDIWSRLGVGLLLYALAYPGLGLLLGLTYPRMPTFGVPCPTTLFTVGALLIARASAPRALGLIPLAWTVIGGSAAFLLGMYADLVLPASGVVLLLGMAQRRRAPRAG